MEVCTGSTMTFGHVPLGSFFVDRRGNICQKCDSSKYVLIADMLGNEEGVIVSGVCHSKAVKNVLNLSLKVQMGTKESGMNNKMVGESCVKITYEMKTKKKPCLRLINGTGGE